MILQVSVKVLAFFLIVVNIAWLQRFFLVSDKLMIELHNIKKSYYSGSEAVVALDTTSLTVKESEIFGIIGRSGAGKSTLLRCVNLLEKPDQGQVIFNGVDLMTLRADQLRQFRQQMGMIFQHFHLLFNKTVYDNIALPLRIKKISESEIKKTIMPLIQLTGLEARMDYFPAQLSGGQKQRVAIARALATKPSLLLCDEATSALDPETTTSILKLLQKINQEMNLTIVLITHEMEVIKQICHRIAVMEHGEIIKQQDTIEFFSHVPSEADNEFVEAYLHREIPELLRSIMVSDPGENHSPIWRICFQGKTVSSPLITNLVNDFQVEVNILQAEINDIQGIAVGIMIVEASGTQTQLQAGLHYLQQQHVTIEVLGYVPRNAIRTI